MPGRQGPAGTGAAGSAAPAAGRGPPQRGKTSQQLKSLEATVAEAKLQQSLQEAHTQLAGASRAAQADASPARGGTGAGPKRANSAAPKARNNSPPKEAAPARPQTAGAAQPPRTSDESVAIEEVRAAVIFSFFRLFPTFPMLQPQPRPSRCGPSHTAAAASVYCTLATMSVLQPSLSSSARDERACRSSSQRRMCAGTAGRARTRSKPQRGRRGRAAAAAARCAGEP